MANKQAPVMELPGQPCQRWGIGSLICLHLVMGLGCRLPGAAWSLAGVGSKQSIRELLGLDPAAIKTAR
jgi:hypothetical protein